MVIGYCGTLNTGIDPDAIAQTEKLPTLRCSVCRTPTGERR